MSIRRLVRTFMKLAFALAGLLAGLGLGEFALRMSVPDSHIDLFRYRADTERYKVMASNCRGVVYGVPFFTNEEGFRDAANGPLASKGPGEFRVVVLGDSFTVCAGVPFAELASTRLESLLRSRAGSRPVRVVNLGVAGYSIIEHAALLDEVALKLEPDCVLLENYVPNDYETKTWLNNREIALGHTKPQPPRWIDTLYLNQAFGPTVESLWGRFTSRVLPVRPAAAPSRPAFGEGSAGWNENTSALLRIAARTRERGIPFRVCLLPHPSNFAKQTAHHETVARFCREHEIAATDVLPRLIATGKSPRAFRINLIDSHPNAAYNAVVAEAMLEALGGGEILREPQKTR